MNLKETLRGMIRPRAPQPEPEKPTFEQMKEVIDLADEFDRLQAFPVWEKILRRLGTEVNGELVEATKFKYEPQRQSVHTIRWDAKREFLDNTLGWIEATQRERDRIIEEYRERSTNGNTSSTDHRN